MYGKVLGNKKVLTWPRKEEVVLLMYLEETVGCSPLLFCLRKYESCCVTEFRTNPEETRILPRLPS